MEPSHDDRDQVEELAEEFLARRRRGEEPTISEYAANHPHLAGQIRDLFPALLLLEKVESDYTGGTDPSAGGGGAPTQLGDYRIIREIGRGGMGIVYEAEQTALGRRVALKVLPPQAVRDEQKVRRFEREARAAAQLHHTNIVPVFEVGRENGVCFYAMQFIHGQGLDEVIEEIRRLRAASSAGQVRPAPTPQAAAILSGFGGPATTEPDSAVHRERAAQTELAPGPARNLPAAGTGLSGAGSARAPYYRSVAGVGRQTALALAYAHGRGIVHRDIKPANLLLDGQGVVWVTDFGVAKTDDEGLTLSGDVVGTLRYVAPERFRGQCDARADVYALGLTLYELLALRPAFDARDRHHLMEQVKARDPPRPRDLDARIPRDLETIVLKAIDKDPDRRYQSAEALADDLRRFLDDEPIRARRTSLPERCARWARRNPAVAALMAAVALLLLLGTALAWYLEARAVAAAELALSNEQLANDNAARAEGEKREAERRGEEARRANDRLREVTYAAQMNLANQAREGGNYNQTRDLLDRYLPEPGRPDPRGFEWYFLSRLRDVGRLTLRGHTAGVRGVAFSRDGTRIASGDLHRTAKVWDAHTGRALLSLRGHAHGIMGVALSPDGTRLATASDDKTVKVWDTRSGRLIHTLTGHTAGVYGVAFSPDGTRLASASQDDTAKVWDVATGAEVFTYRGHRGGLFAVAFSPDGSRIASVCFYGELRVWDAQTGRDLLIVAAHSDRALGVAFSPDGSRLATTSDDGSAKMWDAHTGQELFALPGHGEPAYAVAFSPDGTRLATSSYDNAVKLWDAATGREVRTLKGHSGRVRALAFGPGGTRLASGSNDATVSVWDLGAEPEPLTFRGHASPVQALAVSPDGARVASGSQDGKVLLRALDSGRDVVTLVGHHGGVNGLAFRPDGRLLASASDDKTIKLWDPASGRELRTLTGHTDVVYAVAFSPDGKRLASASLDRSVRLWDAESGRELKALRGHRFRVFTVAFSPDGARLATGSWDQTVKLWDANTGQDLLTLHGHTDGVQAVAFSPNGRLLASVSADNVAKVWDAANGRLIHTLEGHTDDVVGVCFSPDGTRLATASEDHTVKLWDVQSGQELLTLHGHTADLRAVCFTPDGWRLLSAAKDKTVKVWDARPRPLSAADRRLPAAVCQVLAAGAVPFPASGLVAAAACQLAIGDPRSPLETAWWLARCEDEEVGLQVRDAAALTYAPRDANGMIDLGRWPDVCAVSWLYVRGERAVTLVLRAGLNPRLRLNGKTVHDGTTEPIGAGDRVAVTLSLRDGWNVLVARPVSKPESGILSVRLEQAGGQP